MGVRDRLLLDLLFKDDSLLFSIFLVPRFGSAVIIFDGQRSENLLACLGIPVVKYSDTVRCDLIQGCFMKKKRYKAKA